MRQIPFKKPVQAAGSAWMDKLMQDGSGQLHVPERLEREALLKQLRNLGFKVEVDAEGNVQAKR